jgi:hypothetical protein
MGELFDVTTHAHKMHLLVSLACVAAASAVCPGVGRLPTHHPRTLRSASDGNDEVDSLLQLRPHQLEREARLQAYAKSLNTVDFDKVKDDLRKVFTDSKDWWPADYGNYAPFFVRMVRLGSEKRLDFSSLVSVRSREPVRCQCAAPQCACQLTHTHFSSRSTAWRVCVGFRGHAGLALCGVVPVVGRPGRLWWRSAAVRAGTIVGRQHQPRQSSRTAPPVESSARGRAVVGRSVHSRRNHCNRVDGWASARLLRGPNRRRRWLGLGSAWSHSHTRVAVRGGVPSFPPFQTTSNG